jgi:hypothetical protein
MDLVWVKRQTLLSGLAKAVLWNVWRIRTTEFPSFPGENSRQRFSALSDVIIENHHEDQIDYPLEGTVGPA